MFALDVASMVVFHAQHFSRQYFMSTKSVCDLWISMWMMGQHIFQAPTRPQRLLIRQLFINEFNLICRVRYR